MASDFMRAGSRRLGLRKRAESGAGFTLVEVLIALTLIVLVMSATAYFFIHSLAVTRLMQQRQGAVAVAQQAMERVRAQNVSAIVGMNQTQTGATDSAYRVANIDYTVRTVVTPCGVATTGGPCTSDTSAGRTQLYRLDIQVTWKGPAGTSCPSPGNVCAYDLSGLRDPSGRSVESLSEVAP